MNIKQEQGGRESTGKKREVYWPKDNEKEGKS